MFNVQIDYPNYEVKTPQTLAEYTLRCMTVGDELELKSSIIDPSKSVKILDKIIYNCITNKSEQIKDFDSWLNLTTIDDRKALLYGLYHATYGDDYPVTHVCSTCGTQNSSVCKISKGFKIDYYTKKPFEIINEEHTFELPISKVKVMSKIPTLKREMDVVGSGLVIDEELEIYMMYIDTLIRGEDKFVIKNNLVDAVSFIKLLPGGDRKFLEDYIVKNLVKYTVDTSYKVTCKKCNNSYTITLNLVEQFFRAL